MSNLDINKKNEETELQYIWRICFAKDNGLLDKTWPEIADILNKNLRSEDEYYTESAYRKKYQQAKMFYDEVFANKNTDEQTNEIMTQIQQLEKEKIQVRDERNELKRIIREEARKETYMDQIKRSIMEYHTDPIYFNNNASTLCGTDSDLIISFMDVHTGIEIDNTFNEFNGEVLKERIHKYRDKIVSVAKRHNSQNAYIILSELISGIIHPTLRIENNQDMIEQFLVVTDYVSQFLSNISSYFETVNVYVAPGNHSRINPKKEQDLAHENMDNLVIPFLKAKLQNFENIKMHDNIVEQSVAVFMVRGLRVFASHGDKDTMENVVQHFTFLFGVKPDIVFLGHRHTNALQTFYDTKIIQSGCLSGSDEYCMDHRLKNKPEQTISVITDDGIDCIYDVRF